eukprot:TRINITY_DN4080_c0_g2_i1.p1 TRINITY_DN4080_c0_g2~~TRINITY_DN4080_c0_g2_i1.p1  ORF type:complete len:467 (+),score=95.73 TRINITY_DN4080_c0_g2_i1:13-1413(+)
MDVALSYYSSDSVTHFIHYLRSLLSNDLVKGSVCLTLAKVGVSLVQRAFLFLWDQISKKVVVSLAIPSRDESFSCLVEWLNEHPYTQNCRQLTVETVYDQNDADRAPRLVFSPSEGDHFFVYQGKYIWMKRETDASLDISMGGKAEVITLTAFGREKTVFKNLVSDAMELNRRKERGKVMIYTAKQGVWKKFGKPEYPRPMSSIILKEGVAESLLQDISNFRKNSDWYRSLGVPYRRGYLLFGPPGCGKSSFVRAVAGHFGLGICLLNLNNREISDQSINELLNETPRNCVIIIEDIDAAMPSRDLSDEESCTAKHNPGLTLSGLLNALDGIGSQEGRLLFLTTNRKGKLDSALIRPGRVDKYIEFGLATRGQMARFFRKVFPNSEYDLARKMAESIPENTYSMAEIQKYLMIFRNDPELAVQNTNKIAEITSDTAGDLLVANSKKWDDDCALGGSSEHNSATSSE